MRKIVAVTPAGRRHYLELLRHYICADTTIDEWHLWDNCRNDADRRYIEALEAEEEKIRIVRLDKVDGTNRSVNRFYQFCAEEDSFYIKIDDDIVYLPEGFGGALFQQALLEREKYIWWSPLVVNNSVCSWLIKYHSRIRITQDISCQASDRLGWFDPGFAAKMHRKFLGELQAGRHKSFLRRQLRGLFVTVLDKLFRLFWRRRTGPWPQLLSSGCGRRGMDFAYLPSLLQRPGRIIGKLVVAHFSYFTQESELLKSPILAQYYEAAGLSPVSCVIARSSLRQRGFFPRSEIEDGTAYSCQEKRVRSRFNYRTE
jgi:hypothetical protein